MDNREILEVKTVIGDGVEDFNERINKMISDGWQPYGNMCLRTFNNTRPDYIIMMVKYSEKENKICL